MSAEFSVSLEPPQDGSHILRVTGELDMASVRQLGPFLDHLDGNVILDCAGLTFVDASGIRLLLEAAARLASLRLVKVHPSVRRVFELTHTTSLLEAAPGQSAARAARNGSADHAATTFTGSLLRR